MEEDLMGDVFLQDDLLPTIAEHALQCDSLFHKYMTVPDIVPDPSVMDDQMARFTLWASNMEVFGPPNVSLDYRLRFSPTVVEIIHQLLQVICDTLISLKPIDDSLSPQTPSRKRQRTSESGDLEVTMRANEDESESDSDEYQAKENVSKITDTIGGTVTRLFRLSNAVRKSAAAKRAHRIGGYQGDDQTNTAIAEMRLYTDCYIRFRFPNAAESLRSALVEGNALRLRRLCYQRSHRRRINLSIQPPQQTNQGTVQLPRIADKALTVQFTPGALPKAAAVNEISGPNKPPAAPITNATTARQTAIGVLYAKSATEVPRAKSVLVNNKLSFPPIPPTNECPYCGVIIEFRSTARSAMWHDHVMRDLEPFICVFTHCIDSSPHKPDLLTFETTKAWMNHLQNDHGSTWECRAPSHDPITFAQEVEYQQHSVKEHGVPEAHVGTLSSAARRPVLNKILECPFGDDFQQPENTESSVVFSSEALRLHVAAHMKEIALLTLQKLHDDADDNAESFDSGQPSEDGGLGFPKLRGSMYSVLDDEALDFQDEAGDGIVSLRAEFVSPSVEKLNLEERDADGMTKLHRAVLAHDMQLAQSLLEHGETPRSRATGGKTALHYACSDDSHSLDMIRLLVNAATGDTVLNLVDDSGQTALHCAAQTNFVDGIQILINLGADAEILDKNGFSAYLWAVVSGQTVATHTLLTLGPNLHSARADRKSDLNWAASLGRESVADLLLRNGSDVMSIGLKDLVVPLEEAAACGGINTVSLLLQHGADPNYRDRDGWSAMHWAAENGHAEVVNLLLSNGADFDAISSYGTAPLHCAANGGRNDIVRLLLRIGADPLKSTCHGWTPLHHAAFMGHSDVVQTLLNHYPIRSIVSLQDNHGWSLLHLAVHSRSLATVKVLHSNFKVAECRNIGDESGLTPEEWLDLEPASHLYKANTNLAFGKSRCCRPVTYLRLAAVRGNLPMIEMLLSQGHPVNDADSGKRTALYHAAKEGFVHIIDLLLKYGADPNILPTGRLTWEEFISDDAVISRLKQAGYKKQSTDLLVEQQIRLALRGSSEDLRLKKSTSGVAANFLKGVRSVTNAEERKSAKTSLWKRLRGQ